MILDTSKVSLANGAEEAAIDLQPGRELLSYYAKKMTRAVLERKEVVTGSDVVGLVLSNGKKLCGTRNQKVAIHRKKTIVFRDMGEVMIGDTLHGETAGMPVSVRVVGLVYFPRRAVRLVDLETRSERPYMADGVLCR